MIEPGHLLAGAATGFLVGLTGVGGGALMTPILLLAFAIDPLTAVATDLWFAAITKLAGARVHVAAGQVDWQVARRLWWGSLPVALATAAWASLGGSAGKPGWLTTAIGAVVLVTAAGMLCAPLLQGMARRERLAFPERFKAAQPAATVIAGAALGLCVALTSIGAGALGSVALLYLYPLRMKPHRLVATDLVHAIPLAMVAGLGYLWLGQVDTHLLAGLLAGSLPAVLLGSRLAGRLPGRWVQVALAVVLTAIGLKVVF